MESAKRFVLASSSFFNQSDSNPQFAVRNPQFNASSSLQALVSIRPFFNPQFAFRNPQFNAAIGNSNNIREGLLRLAEIPDAQEEKEGDNRH